MTEPFVMADAIRPFWLAGLNNVSGNCRKELKGWINDEKFQIYATPSDNSFTLSVSEPSQLLKAYAAEISRISIASGETMTSILVTPPVKKSIAWLLIQTYYAAFFAAHSFARLLGTSCFPLEAHQVRSITKISKLFGQEPDSPISGGLYRVTFNPLTKEVQGLQIKSMKAGPHEAFWRLFCDILDSTSSNMLNLPALTLTTAQAASCKLGELLSNLSFNNSARGSWLSSVRNRVNYEQSWATWYPYSQRQRYYGDLSRHINDWNLEPSDIDLVSHQNRDLRRFQSTCNMIMALNRVTIEDMARRCSAGKSFHDFGWLAYRRHFLRLQ